MNQKYGLTRNRYATVIKTLEEVETYLNALNTELAAITPSTDQPGDHWIEAVQAKQAVARLRHALVKSHSGYKLS